MASAGQLFDFQNPQPQRFALPSTYMVYILSRRTNPESYRKLARTCKLIYSRDKLLPVKGLKCGIHDTELFHIHTDTADANSFFDFPIQEFQAAKPNLWIYDGLEIKNYAGGFITFHVWPRVELINITKLDLSFVIIPFKDYKTVTASKTIKTLNLYEAPIVNEKGRALPLEDIVGEVVNVVSLNIQFGLRSFAVPNFEKLIAMSPLKNLRECTLKGISRTVDDEMFAKFIKENQHAERFNITYTYHNKLRVGYLKEAIVRLENQGELDIHKPRIVVNEMYRLLFHLMR